MTNYNAPQKFDFVGSFLRPAKLKAARSDFETGRITTSELKAVEDKCIESLIKRQKDLGYKIVTDGEFRRATWHLDFMWGFDGIDHKPTEHGLPFHDEAAMIDDTYLVGKISVKDHPFIDHFKFTSALAGPDASAKQTIPAPAQFLEQFLMPFARENTRRFYPNDDVFIADAVDCYKKVIAELYAAGCRNLQLDDCSWGLLVDPSAKFVFGTDEKGIEKIKELFLEVNNAVIDSRPDDLVINTHVCRGNFHSTYASTGAYDGVAETLLKREHVNAYYLEFDDERSGGFEPLKFVSDDKKVVLGLITTKSPKLEDKQTVIKRIREAEKYIPRDRLCLSPQCGFASCEIGNKLTEEEQWAKLKLVKEIAEEAL